MVSLSARRAWIEIDYAYATIGTLTSLSARRAWIEICLLSCMVCAILVALRKESVDRNPIDVMAVSTLPVALRKESVDRNSFNPQQWHLAQQSLSARRAWIEM